MTFERNAQPPEKNTLERRIESTARNRRHGLEGGRHPYKDSAAHESRRAGAGDTDALAELGRS